VTWSFVVLTVTGVVLYVVPQGRVANWIFWSLAGLDKNGWADVHLLFGAVFILAGALHLYFNWKPFRGYLAQRVRGHLALKRELATSLAATLLLTLGAVFAVSPVSWPFDLNDAAKSVWSRAPGHEPPYPRAETTPLPVSAKRFAGDLPQGSREPLIFRITDAARLALVLAVGPAAGSGLDLGRVRRLAENPLRDRLLNVPEVAEAEVFGGDQRQVSVALESSPSPTWAMHSATR